MAWCIIPAALEEAPSCAAAILGDESRPYRGTIPANNLKVAGVELYSAGIVETAGLEGVEELRYQPSPTRYERYVLREGKLAGVIVLGSKERARAAAKLMGGALTRAEVERSLAD